MEENEKKIPLKNRILKTLKKWLMVILNPKLFLCLFIAWMITNGWSYIFTLLGTTFDITWMTVAGTAYMSLLWVPFTPEKIITVIIALFLMRLIFPNDKKTVAVLKTELHNLKTVYKRQRKRRHRLRSIKRTKKQKKCI